jgi:hypothetical protein
MDMAYYPVCGVTLLRFIESPSALHTQLDVAYWVLTSRHERRRVALGLYHDGMKV